MSFKIPVLFARTNSLINNPFLTLNESKEDKDKAPKGKILIKFIISINLQVLKNFKRKNKSQKVNKRNRAQRKKTNRKKMIMKKV